MPGPVQDYLAAPMPFLMGLHAPNLFMPTLRSGSLEEVVIVDLDRGCLYNGPGQPLPKCALPWADQLRDALDLLKQTLRSPVEHESTPHIISLMQVICFHPLTVSKGRGDMHVLAHWHSCREVHAHVAPTSRRA